MIMIIIIAIIIISTVTAFSGVLFAHQPRPNQSFKSYTEHLLMDSCSSQHDLKIFCHCSYLWYFFIIIIVIISFIIY